MCSHILAKLHRVIMGWCLIFLSACPEPGTHHLGRLGAFLQQTVSLGQSMNQGQLTLHTKRPWVRQVPSTSMLNFGVMI